MNAGICLHPRCLWLRSSCAVYMCLLLLLMAPSERKEKHHPCTHGGSAFVSRENLGPLAVIDFPNRKLPDRQRAEEWMDRFFGFYGNEISGRQAGICCCFYRRDRHLLFVNTSEELLGMHVRSVLTRKRFHVAYHHCASNTRDETARRQFQFFFVWGVLVFCGKIGFLFSLPYFPFIYWLLNGWFSTIKPIDRTHLAESPLKERLVIILMRTLQRRLEWPISLLICRATPSLPSVLVRTFDTGLSHLN